jgi:hypothetical protein
LSFPIAAIYNEPSECYEKQEYSARRGRYSKADGVLTGANFWAFGGISRLVKDQIFWKKGDDFMGDPPMEEQGLSTVFDSDKSTWKIINQFSQTIGN